MFESSQYWYNSQNSYPTYASNCYWGNPSYQADSRRNIGNAPANPVNPFAQYGQVGQTQYIPESAVQPFSSYPPSTPSGISGAGGLNSFVETRRNTVPASTAPQNNPWVANQPATVQAPVQTMTQPQNALTWGCIAPENHYSGPQWNYPVAGFDKKGCWQNEYTQPKQLDMPANAWQSVYQQPAQQNVFGGYQQFNYSTLDLNSGTHCQPVADNWLDIATKNWSPDSL